MNENWHLVVIGSLVLSGGSIVGIIAFWMKLGSQLTAGVHAGTIASAAVGKIELLAREFNDYRVEAAKEFVTSKDLAHAENRMSTAVEAMRSEMRGMNDRLDRLLESVAHRVS
jgi:hypothetical protein